MGGAINFMQREPAIIVMDVLVILDQDTPSLF